MRGLGMAPAIALALGSAPAEAQEGAPAPANPRTAEQFIETAREFYSVEEPEPEPEPECEAAAGNEIVVCAQGDKPLDQSLPSPTERAYAAGEKPPDRIPDAPDVFGLPPCSAYTYCGKVGPTPVAPLIIDLAAIPEGLTPEEAAHVFRAEDRPSPAEASPAGAP